MSKFLLWKAFLVFATFVSGGTALAETPIPKWVIGVVVLTIGGLSAATTFVDNQVRTDNSEIVARRSRHKDGTIRAGEASAAPTGTALDIGMDPLNGRSVALMPLAKPAVGVVPSIT